MKSLYFQTKSDSMWWIVKPEYVNSDQADNIVLRSQRLIALWFSFFSVIMISILFLFSSLSLIKSWSSNISAIWQWQIVVKDIWFLDDSKRYLCPNMVDRTHNESMLHSLVTQWKFHFPIGWIGFFCAATVSPPPSPQPYTQRL